MDAFVQSFVNFVTLILGLSISWSPIGSNLECQNENDKAGMFFNHSALSISLGAHEFARHKAKKSPLEATDKNDRFYILENDDYLFFEYLQNTVREKWRLPSGQIQTWTQKMWDEAYKNKYIIRYHAMFHAIHGLALDKKTLSLKRYRYSMWPSHKIKPAKWVWLKTDNNKKFPLNHKWQKLEWPQPTDKEQQKIWPRAFEGHQGYQKIKNLTTPAGRWAKVGGETYKCTPRRHPWQTSAWKHVFE